MRQESATADATIARIAAGQHGVVTFEQLVGAGLSPSGISRRVHTGRLHRIHRGVYAVGHRSLSNEGRWIAAVFACGEGAALSHRSAAELWALLKPRGGLIHVTVPTKAGRKRHRGIRLHRSPSVLSVTTRHNDIAVTTPARTIADLRRVASVDEVRRAIREAEFHRYDVSEERANGDAPTRSWLERRFLRMCRRHNLPEPEVNAIVGPHEVDFLWRDRRLIVETDGWDAHSGRQAFEDDRAKDAELRVLGFTIQRFTYRQVTQRWEWVGADRQGAARVGIGALLPHTGKKAPNGEFALSRCSVKLSRRRKSGRASAAIPARVPPEAFRRQASRAGARGPQSAPTAP